MYLERGVDMQPTQHGWSFVGLDMLVFYEAQVGGMSFLQQTLFCIRIWLGI